MLAVTVRGTYKEVAEGILKANQLGDLIELRLDFLEKIDLSLIAALKNLAKRPLIFTLKEKKELLFDLLALEPEYVDLSLEHFPFFASKIRTQFPKTQIILSYHNFEKTPEDLPALLQKIRSFPAAVFKIATRANSSLDALRMLIFLKEIEVPCVGLCMGKLGELTRIAAPLTKGMWTYAPLYPDEELAGKITAEHLHTIYRYPSLNPKTAFYALLGNPLDSSRGEIVYNQAFQVANKNALYCKIPLHKKELSSFFSLSQKLPFSGFSITMPLKEAILPFVDSYERGAEKISAINTLVREGGKWKGANTDGIGALRAIEEKLGVKGKRVALIGCGGAARAIAYELTKKEAILVVSHKDQRKAKLFAADFHCSALSLKELENTLSSFDLLINATPLGMAPYLNKSPVDPKFLFSNLAVFDVVSQPEETFLLQEARKRGCKIIFGSKMYEYQAIGQRERWLRN